MACEIALGLMSLDLNDQVNIGSGNKQLPKPILIQTSGK